MPEQQPPHPQRFPPPAYAAQPVYPVYGAPSHYPCYPPHYGAPPLPGSAHHHIRYEYLNPHRDTTDTTPTGEATKQSESRQEESTREIPITTSTKEARVPTNPDSLKKDPAEKKFTETTSNPPSSTVTTIATSGVPQGPKNPQISTLTMHYPPTSSTAPHPGWYHQQQLSYHHHHPHAPAPYSAVMHKGIPLPPPVPAGYPVAYPPHHHTHNPTGVSYVVYPATMSHPPQPTSTNNHIQPSVSSETTSSTSHHQEHHSSFLKPSDSNDLPKQDTALPTPGNAPKSTTITSEDISVGQDESSENVSQKGIASNQDTSATVSSSSFSSAPAEELSSNSQVQSTMPEAADALLSLAMLRYTPSHTAPPAPTTTSKDSQGSHHEDSTSRSVKRKAEDSCMADEATTVGHRTVKQSKTAGHDTQGSRNHHHHSSSTRVTLPYQKHHSPESHKVAVHRVSQRSLSMEEEEGSICTCKKSRCLKLYCDCLGAGTFCSSRCKCLDCGNIPGSKDLLAAAESIKKKMQESKTLKKSRGVVTCKCSKSGCLKKYCECFKGGLFCGADCVCRDCKNFEGSEEFRMRKLAQLDYKAKALQSAQEQQTTISATAKKHKSNYPVTQLRAAMTRPQHYPEYPPKPFAYPGTLLSKHHASTSASAFRPSPSKGSTESHDDDTTNHKVTPTSTFEKESSSTETPTDASIPGKVKRALVQAPDNVVVSPGSTCSHEPRAIAANGTLHIPN